jgi:hypothetical protein
MIGKGDGGISPTHSDQSAVDTDDSQAFVQRQEMVRAMHMRIDDRADRYEKIVCVWCSYNNAQRSWYSNIVIHIATVVSFSLAAHTPPSLTFIIQKAW